MKKILRMGDPHVKPNNIEESERLLTFVSQTAISNQVDRIEILGDLMHTHNIVRLEVISFWDKWLDKLSDICETVVLVGNHDQSGDYRSYYNSLSVFNRMGKENLKIIQSGIVDGYYAYVPYMHNKNEFVSVSNQLADQGATVLVCHQTIEGSKYENGMFAPDGVDSELLSGKFKHIISGHIHSEQNFGRVMYPGTPRWDTVSDANRRKGIWIYEHGTTGTIHMREFISTENVCSPIFSVKWEEGQEEPQFPAGARVSVELIGSSVWVAANKLKLMGKVSVRTRITDKTSRNKKVSAGTLENFVLNHFKPKPGVSNEQIVEYMREL